MAQVSGQSWGQAARIMVVVIGYFLGGFPCAGLQSYCKNLFFWHEMRRVALCFYRSFHPANDLMAID
jgi:hypothetical protein